MERDAQKGKRRLEGFWVGRFLVGRLEGFWLEGFWLEGCWVGRLLVGSQQKFPDFPVLKTWKV
jgi:hypothetical protein